MFSKRTRVTPERQGRLMRLTHLRILAPATHSEKTTSGGRMAFTGVVYSMRRMRTAVTMPTRKMHPIYLNYVVAQSV